MSYKSGFANGGNIMKVTIENGKIIFREDNKEYSFEAHGEYPRPSIMPAISVAGTFLDIPKEHISKYTSPWTNIKLTGFENGRLYFKCFLYYFEENVPYEEKARNCHSFGLPSMAETQISCGIDGKNITIEADRSDIVTEEKPYSTLQKEKFDFPMVTKKAFRNEQQINE